EGEEGLFALTSDRLREAVAQQTASHGRDVLFAVRERPELAIGADAPELIARQAFEQDRDLPSVMRETGLGDYSQGNYAETARRRLYLDRIAKADPRNSYDWLADLCESDVADAPAGDGRRCGQLVLEAMTQRPVDNPRREGDSTMLKDGDAPRARRTIKWNKRWSRIPSEHLRRVIAWRSGEDIRLFLEAVEVYGRKNNKADLLGM